MDKNPLLSRPVRRVIGRVLTAVPFLARIWSRQFQTVSSDTIPFVPLEKPLAQCRLALVTTGGVHLIDQQPYDMDDPRGDPTYRVIPAETPRDHLMITHDYYDHSDAERDLNILFPMQLIHDLIQQGVIGSLATCYSFMGHIEPPHVDTLLQQTAPEVAGMLKQEQVDAALMTPA